VGVMVDIFFWEKQQDEFFDIWYYETVDDWIGNLFWFLQRFCEFAAMLHDYSEKRTTDEIKDFLIYWGLDK
jgi:hypothetical protein